MENSLDKALAPYADSIAVLLFILIVITTVLVFVLIIVVIRDFRCTSKFLQKRKENNEP